MTTSLRWTSADLEALPNDGKRYEIIDGELYVSRQPHWYHRYVSGLIFTALEAGSEGTGHANLAPGLIFADDDDAVPVGAAPPYGAKAFEGKQKLERTQWAWRAHWRGAARGYLVASGAWFALFVGGAVLLYIPFQWMIPATLPATLTAASLYVQRDAGDLRQSPAVLELRGGHYTLSTREMMRVTVESGIPSGLWRAHVYERYTDSRWRESPIDLETPIQDDTDAIARGDRSRVLRDDRCR